jgi:hypothetical protein
MGASVQIINKPEELRWTRGDNSGFLTMKNVYLALANKLWLHPIGGWQKKLWTWDCALKIKLFTWLYVANKILTWDNLQHKGWIGPNICHLCLKAREIVLHLFVDCAFTKKVWERGKRALYITSIWEGSTLVDCYDSWNLQNTNYPTLPVIISWFVWLERNMVIFENKSPTVHTVIIRVLGGVGSVTKKQILKVDRPIKEVQKDHVTKGWFDGAALSNGGLSGVGRVLWLNEHSTINWTLNCGPGTNTRAELLGVWETLTIASRMHISKIQVYGDS